MTTQTTSTVSLRGSVRMENETLLLQSYRVDFFLIDNNGGLNSDERVFAW